MRAKYAVRAHLLPGSSDRYIGVGWNQRLADRREDLVGRVANFFCELALVVESLGDIPCPVALDPHGCSQVDVTPANAREEPFKVFLPGSVTTLNQPRP